ncbi:hypothetical protein [Paenibacillus sanguinis]|uniref:hypothetical protein n=1 Tax=Paenibacillus sanguinis TaxID=225906 RepID=UPI0003639CFE|nr:hypothetical protein [Paenibacillus sanguinis]
MVQHIEWAIETARFIDFHRIEIMWRSDVEGAGNPRSYLVELDGKVLPVYLNEDKEAWDSWCVYEQSKRRTTLYLQKPIELGDLGKVKLSVIGSIRDKPHNQLIKLEGYPIKSLESFYTRFTRSSSGILIKSSDNVDFEIHQRACTIIEIMLGKRPEITRKLVEHGAALAIYGLQENAYDVPEHRGGADFLHYEVEGFGGMTDIPVTSVSEKNIMRYTEGPYQTKYKHESILAHEFGHAIHLIGINNLEDQTLAGELVNAYKHAVDHRLWPNTYAISNYEEYFATLTAVWFNVMAESKDGSWDGVRGPVNTRDELKSYDPVGYAFFASIYPECTFPEPWSSTPNQFPAPSA